MKNNSFCHNLIIFITFIMHLTFFAGSLLAESKLLNIPEDYSTIQAGIDAASAGDTVLVAPREILRKHKF